MSHGVQLQGLGIRMLLRLQNPTREPRKQTQCCWWFRCCLHCPHGSLLLAQPQKLRQQQRKQQERQLLVM
jgi:hypothetical protein